ncbi:hypothetical protein XELAEV_18019738mg [Xenopus laevis]|uniref:Uncharacterized protein n=1 Tax=Xenopus laevis TaxID=8355 RepID=A0A974HPY4_XENLA|nr:hypothetical protein XELAEV_18019738mg [Xenopus laevis]
MSRQSHPTYPQCHRGPQTEHDDGCPTHPNLDTSPSVEATLSSAALIGHRLSVIGDEFNTMYAASFPSRIGRIVRTTVRVASDCWADVRDALRSVRNTANRVDHGASGTAGQWTLGRAAEPDGKCRKLLLAIGLIAVSGILMKLGLGH